MKLLETRFCRTRSLLMLSLFLVLLAVPMIQTVDTEKNETKAKDERQRVLMATYLTLRWEQHKFAGDKSAIGCYEINNNKLQKNIDRYSFTASELGQSISKLFCDGHIVPSGL